MRILRAFIDFVTCYNDILLRQKKLQSLDHVITDISQQISDLRNSISQKHKEIIEQRKAIDGQELELKVLDAQETDKKKRLESANAVKEFQSLTSELEIINAKKNSLETALFERLTALENYKEQVRLYEQATQQTIDTLVNQQNNLEQTKKNDSQYLEKLKEECLQKRQRVNKDMITRFEEMQTKVANPSVPIINDSCSACFYAISQMQLGQAKKGELVQCNDCYRLLYFE